jgi:signal transduction histidine kinase
VTASGRRALATLGLVGYAVLFLICTALSVAGLALGAVAGLAARIPAVAASLETVAGGGDLWAEAVMAAARTPEPTAQLALDYGFSLLSLGLAAALLLARERTWAIRLLALAVVGSAGAFNLQAHAAVGAVESVAGPGVGLLFRLPLSGAVCAAYLLALTVFPGQAGTPPRTGSTRTALVAGGGTLLLIGVVTALLPQATCSVVLLGILVPVAGSSVLWVNSRRAPLVVVRTQSRQMFSVLAAAFAVTTVLTVLTLVLWAVGWDGLDLIDPTAGAAGSGGQPIALLFWFSRLVCVVIPGAVLVATRRSGSFTAEHLFSRGLVAAVVAAVVAGGYILLRALGESVTDQDAPGGELALAALAILPVALVSLPLYVRVERAVDRLLYGSRPTPYRVLAGIAALSRGSPDGPDLARVAEAVGRDLSASACWLTVMRPGLRDRIYTWAAPGVTAEPAVEVAIRHGRERIGSIAVDHGAVAGLQGQRHRLLEDVADSLGAVLQANRAGIELERQLRAALAYADGIAMSRRAAVAEMDWERRRIERDLHDGAQHHLVSLRLTLGLVEHQVSTGQLDPARARLAQIAEQIDVAEQILAETAMGVSSPLLAELGLVRALRGELGAGQPPVAVDARGVDETLPIPGDVEAAVYFCCLEAVNNARKHARGAAIEVRLETADGHLRFVVRDHGPGRDMAGGMPSAGRGIRNLVARVGMVGGWVDVRSAPGVGTTVEGSAPLRLAPADATPGTGVRPALAAAMTGSQRLVDQVRDALRAARELYHNTRRAEELRDLAERLDAPLRIAVSGPPGCGVSTLVETLRVALEDQRVAAHAAQPAVHLIDLSGTRPTATAQKIVQHGPGPAGADASILLLIRHRGDTMPADRAERRSALTVGVLARVDELGAVEPGGEGMALAERAAAELAVRPEVRRRCPVVVPVAGLLAHAAATLTDAEFATLRGLSVPSALPGSPHQDARDATAPVGTTDRTGSTTVAIDPAADVVTRTVVDPEVERLRRRFGPSGVRLSVVLIRSGRASSAAELAAELTRRSGLPVLVEQLVARFGRRADGIQARSALWALEALVRGDPPPHGADGLRYRIDRIRSGTHELAELDLVDRLRSGELDLPANQRESAARLLGAMGTEPRVRLALAPEARSQDVAAAAAEQLAHWRALAARPVTGKVVRDVAATLVQTCEQLLAGTSAG